MTTENIPVVNLDHFTTNSEFSQQVFVSTLGKTLESIGFAPVLNSGVDVGLIDSAYRVAREFFELPAEVKHRYEDPQDRRMRGFISFGREHLRHCPTPDLKEFYHVGRELPQDHALASAYPPNLFPKEISEFQGILTQLYQQLESCAQKLLKACSLYLEQPLTVLSDMAEEGDTTLRISHYPPINSEVNPLSERAAAHEDIVLITLLCEGTAEGLEYLIQDGTWCPVKASRGQIIIHIGDTLELLTNGLLKSTTHRVVKPQDYQESRFSLAFFVRPRPSVTLMPFSECIAKTGGQSRFPAIKAGEFFEQRFREVFLV